MILLLLAGILALIFGRITLTRSLKFRGKSARVFGAALIISIYTIVPVLASFISFVVPSSFFESSFKGLLDIAVTIPCAIGIALLTRKIYPLDSNPDKKSDVENNHTNDRSVVREEAAKKFAHTIRSRA